MYQPSFNGAWAKVERAKEHRDALYDYIGQAFTRDEDRPLLSVKFNPRTGEHEAYVSQTPDMERPLTRASAILGDVVQNLRNSLNLFCFELALRNLGGSFPTPEREGRVQFPIEDDPTMFAIRCSPPPRQEGRGWIADLAEADRAMIKEVQPYHRQHPFTYKRADRLHHPLADLRDLSNMDKHRRLTDIRVPPTNIVSRSAELPIIVMRHMERQPRGGPYRLPFVELGAVLFHAVTSELPQTQVEVAGYVQPEITLPDGRGAINVADSLGKIVAFVLGKVSPYPDWLS